VSCYDVLIEAAPTAASQVGRDFGLREAARQQLFAGRDAVLVGKQVGQHRTTMPDVRLLRLGHPQPVRAQPVSACRRYNSGSR
jgi:hypothetical protein